jgi:DNA-binding response OmpR family regulator
MANGTILVADDDPDILMLVATMLEREGHVVVRAEDGQAAVKCLFERRPDLVILDIDMPRLDGWQVLERIREVSSVPVIMLTAQGGELDKVRGLRGGADDYVTKPFGRQELAARVDAALRRGAAATEAAAPPDVTQVGTLTIDHEQRLASIGGEELNLTPLEFRLLAVFARNPRQILSNDRIIDLVWDDDYTATEQVKLLVGRLRKKIAGQPGAPEIETVRGFGYRLKPGD